jgi:hypothetical protein
LDKEHLWSGLQRVVEWYARVKLRPSFISAAPTYKNRMWGPKKPVTNPRA